MWKERLKIIRRRSNENREDGSEWTPKDRKANTEVQRSYEGETSKDIRSQSLHNVEIENSMRRPQVRKRPKKKEVRQNNQQMLTKFCQTYRVMSSCERT